MIDSSGAGVEKKESVKPLADAANEAAVEDEVLKAECVTVAGESRLVESFL